MEVYPLNPQSAQAYRERKAPSGVKDDRLDGWSFADALRVDGQNWKPLRPESALIKELRLLCRDEVELIEERTALVNKLRHALAEYYPIALEAFEDWISLSAWMFLQRFPTPQALEKAGKRQWEKFLHSRHLWRNESGPRRMELFAKATEFCGSQGTTNANRCSPWVWSKGFLSWRLSFPITANGSRNSFNLILIMTSSALCLGLDPRLLPGCCPKSAMIAIASGAMCKTFNA